MTERLISGQDYFEYTAAKTGPALLVFGAIHGNEKAGSAAIRAAIQDIEAGDLVLTRGRLTMVPVCNPKAYAQNTRFFEKNLNRVFCRHARPACYEEARANLLTDLVDRSCTHLLDLHTQGTPAAPFVFQDKADDRTRDFAASLRTEVIVTGWPDMYAVASPALNEGDTAGYAGARGIAAAVVECGHHADPRGPSWAQNAILNALAHLEMIEAPVLSPPFQRVVRGYQVATCPGEAWSLTRAWRHLDAVRAGEAVAAGPEGAIEAPVDSVILLPKPMAKQGQEWFYLGVDVRPR